MYCQLYTSTTASLLFKTLVLALFFFPLAVGAQQQDTSVITGSVKGRVKDSTYNFMLTSATVAVYRDADSSLLQFSIPNNFGEFIVQPLPLDFNLRVIITHVGYTTFFKKFILTKDSAQVDFGLLYLHQNTDSSGNMLKEVVVTNTPPVRMNGDTLEFNADAFKLNANATAEDLIRRLPGFTIWGDGDITFNGKKITQVFVEGKPFMGSSDATIATQNLPKEALDKIQVYQQRDEKNPLDSTMFANLKLKDDKKMGYFGKLSSGFGSDSRYAADGMVSGFNKKLQVSSAGALNNINKMAGNMDVLMHNTTFKGEGANADYQSDFNMHGLNKPIAAGLKLQYDFIPDPGYYKTSRLYANYFMKSNNALANNTATSNTFLTADTLLTRHSISESRNNNTNHASGAHYEKSNEKMNLSLNCSIYLNDENSKYNSSATQQKTGLGQLNKTITENENQSIGRNITTQITYNNRSRWDGNRRRIPSEFGMSYNFAANETQGTGHTRTQFISTLDSSENKIFDRRYSQRNSAGQSHSFSFNYPAFKRLIFNRAYLGGIEMDVRVQYTYENRTSATKAEDLDTAYKKYKTNNYLSNSTDLKTDNFIPSFRLSKSFHKGLTNRYNKWTQINVELKNQFYSATHMATQAVQNFSYRYSRFIPQANIGHHIHQYGSYETSYDLGFSTEVDYPDAGQIAPLIDSSNIWSISKGNRNIQPEYRKSLNFTYQFTSRTSRNPYSFSLTSYAGQTDKSVADSTIYGQDGRQVVYLVNLDGRRNIGGTIRFQKSQELKKSNLEFHASYSIDKSRNPGYINHMLNVSNSINQNITASIIFTYKDITTLKFEEGLGLYNSQQQGFDSRSFKSINRHTRFIGTLQFPKNLVWSSNITYNKSSSNNTGAVYFTIWNASLTYRFLKGKQGEAKFSVLDILKQNKGIENTATRNTQSFTTNNVLQQYFMLTFSYYPRKFGK